MIDERYKKGEHLRASTVNKLIEHGNAIETITGGGRVNVRRTGHGVVITLRDEPSLATVATAASVKFGKPTAAYSSGATITLDPCDVSGADNGEANVTVNAGWTITDCTIATTTIIPFQRAADGDYEIVGNAPKKIHATPYYDETAHKFQWKHYWSFGTFLTEESSSFEDIVELDDCMA